MKKPTFLLIFVLFISTLYSQQINGNLKHNADEQLVLYGYKGFNTIQLGATIIDSVGDFSIKYPKYNGMGYIESSDKANITLVLNEDNITIVGTHLHNTASISVISSLENKLFKQYAIEHNQRNAVLAAWKYLFAQYENITLLKQQNSTIYAIHNEISRLNVEDSMFLVNIDTTTYVSWYLPIRKLIDDMPVSARQYTNRITQNIDDFRQINLNDKRLYNSGIFNELLQTHYWLLENMGQSLDSIDVQMNLTTNYIIHNLQYNDSLLNMASKYLFNLLEQRSLYVASEHLALKMLTQNSCVLETKLANQLETYRAMKVGNIAPDISFLVGKLISTTQTSNKSSLKSLNYATTLVVFGASWCTKCTEDIAKLQSYYYTWQAKGLDVIFISIDSDELAFTEFAKELPWLSYCDMQGWDSKAARDYYVSATPTLFLLDSNGRILIRPVSVEHVNAWVEQKM